MAKAETKIDMGIEVTKLWYRDSFGTRASVIKYRDPYGADPLQQSSSPNEEAPIYVALEGRQPELLINVLNELERFRTRDSMQKQDKLKEADELLAEMQSLYDSTERLMSPPTVGPPVHKKHWWSRK